MFLREILRVISPGNWTNNDPISAITINRIFSEAIMIPSPLTFLPITKKKKGKEGYSPDNRGAIAPVYRTRVTSRYRRRLLRRDRIARSAEVMTRGKGGKDEGSRLLDCSFNECEK